MNNISAVIITQNEERNIARCIESLQGVADEIVVVDSGSNDRTQQICTQYKNLIFQFHSWEGYSAQKNYANSLASNPWILSIDADEALSPTLRDSLLTWKALPEPQPAAYRFNRLTNYCGHWIHHCGWYPDPCTRLFPKDAAHWDGLVHEQLTFHSPLSDNATHLKGDLLHYSYYSVEEHAERQVRYATLAAHKAHEAGRTVGALGIWLRPKWNFFRNYLLKGGFLDGHAGYTVCRMSAFYTFLKYSILKTLNVKR